MKTLLRAALILSAACLTQPIASAQNNIQSITTDGLRATLQGLGHTILDDEEAVQNGFLVQATNGFRYIVLFKACNEAGACGGLLIGSLHPIPEGLTWELLNAADAQSDLYGLYIMNERLVIDRYVNLEGGVDASQIGREVNALVTRVPSLVAAISQASAAAPAPQGG